MTMICGVSGDIGSFSEQAALAYFKQRKRAVSFRYLIDMETVLVAIENDEISLGIFPVVNLRGGLVKPAFIAMARHQFTVIDDYWLDVEHCLLALPGTTKQEIKQITSHPQGLAQCNTYLHHHFKTTLLTNASNTAKAARDLREGHYSPNTAVIASKQAARAYGLTILDQNIQDDHPNYTIFIIVTTTKNSDVHVKKEWQHA